MPICSPTTCFFLHDKLSGLIDFYFACNDFFAYDVAICLNAWCFEPDNVLQRHQGAGAAAGLRQGAAARRRRARVLPLLARGAALRFLLTRLYDWVHTPADALVKRKDPHEYLAKLRFHRGTRRSRTTGCYGLMSDSGRGRDLHRRRLQRQSRTGRLGRDPARRAAASANSPAASPRPPTTAWS